MLLTKKLELRLRDIVSRVHAKRLEESLQPVEQAIAEWRAGNATPFQVDEAIYQHHLRSRRLFALYANTPVTSMEMRGILLEARTLGIIAEQEFRELDSIRPASRKTG